MKFEFSAGGIVYKKEADKYYFCLILNPYDKWTFPKGRIEKKEKPEIAALREVKEEIGLKDIKLIKRLNKIEYWFKRDAELIHKYVYFYLMEAVDTKLTHQKEEIQEAKWFFPSEAIKNLGYPKEDAETLKLAFEELNIQV